jgi:hypothetical protein
MGTHRKLYLRSVTCVTDWARRARERESVRNADEQPTQLPTTLAPFSPSPVGLQLDRFELLERLLARIAEPDRLACRRPELAAQLRDRKSTRLNSSHNR